MSKLTVIAKVVAKQDSIEQVKRALVSITAPTREEAGCVEYYQHQDNGDPATFMLYENWESEADLDNHFQTAHFKILMAAMDGKTEEIIVNKLTRID